MTDHEKAIYEAADAIERAFSEDTEAPAMVLAGRAITAYLAALGEAGSVVVPALPTDAMYQAAMVEDALCPEAVYLAMLAARPRIAEAKE